MKIRKGSKWLCIRDFPPEEYGKELVVYLILLVKSINQYMIEGLWITKELVISGIIGIQSLISLNILDEYQEIKDVVYRY